MRLTKKELPRTTVLIEMGVKGGRHPHERVGISCLLGDDLEAAGTDLSEFTDLEPFEVVVLHPGRTLLEKLVHIHAMAQAYEATMPELYFATTPLPTWEEICSRVAERGELL